MGIDMSKTLNTTCLFGVNLIARRGDTFQVYIEFTDDQDNPIDITSSTWRCNILDLDVIAPNIIRLSESAIKMSAMSIGDYKYDIEETMIDGSVKTRVNGLFTVKKDYTI